MKVLIACEFSGIVRDAFIAKGHDAISCDLLPTESAGPHYEGDVFDIINDDFDLMIAHPPCTYISYAGAAYWNKPGRIIKRLEALEFFRKLWEAPINKICLENPKSCASPVIAKYTQEIQPYFWGDSAVKTTWLWLKNIPQLIHYEQDDLFNKRTSCDTPKGQYYKSGRKKDCTDIMGDGFTGDERRKERARFWPGIAEAMATQWGS